MGATTEVEREVSPDVTERPQVTHALVLSKAEPVAVASPAEVASLVAQKDEAQILAACMGAMIDEWVYEFPIQGQTVEGISVTGAMEIARIRAEQGFPIRLIPATVEELVQNGEPGIRCVIIARDVRTGAEGLGMAFYPFNEQTKKGPRPDRFADRKALSVAKRNAVLDIIPATQALQLLKARKAVVKANAERLEAERQQAAKHVRPARTAQAKRVTAGELREENQADAYEQPKQFAPEQATEAQVEKLLDLADRAQVPPETRQRIEAELKKGLAAKKAEAWITTLERKVADTQASQAAGGELGLDDKRPSPSTRIQD